MADGTVKWFDKKKGYGFIEYQDAQEIFVHYTSFADENLRTLDDGDEVSFDIEQGEKGPRATNLTKKQNHPASDG
jgi:CspA family cold shock protein